MTPGNHIRPGMRLTALLLALAMVLAACSGATGSSQDADSAGEPNPTGDGSDTTAADQTGSGGPVHGGTLRLSVTGDPPTLNPNLSTHAALTEMVGLYAEGLVTLNSNLEPEPGLATDWEVSEDGRNFVFHLREGVTWHDGDPFGADDVVYTLDTALEQLPTAERFAPYIEEVIAVDDHTVEMTLTEPYAAIFVGLSRVTTQILPAHIYEGTDLLDNPANLSPIGTGPYEFVSWDEGQSLEFQRYDEYWDGDKPYFDRVVLQVMPDSTAKVNALRNGEIDFVSGGDLPLSQLQQLAETPGVQVHPSGDTPAHDLLLMNTESGPLGDPAVRRAIGMAIDRERIVETGYQGAAEAAVGPFPPVYESLFPDDAPTYADEIPYDPQAAAALLDEAGYPESGGERFSLRLTYASGSFSVGTPVTATIRAMLSEIGIDVQLEDVDDEVWVEQIFIEEDYDMTFSRYSTFSDPALGVHRIYLCEDDPEATYTNPTGYCNEELDEVLTRAATSVDPAARRNAYAEATPMILADLPALMVVMPSRDGAISDRIANVDAQINSGPQSNNWAEAWFKDE